MDTGSGKLQAGPLLRLAKTGRISSYNASRCGGGAHVRQRGGENSKAAMTGAATIIDSIAFPQDAW
jgi:hypothetical protein